MLYNYREALNIYKTDYMLKKAIENKSFFRIEKGIYSDGDSNYTEIELVLKKYGAAFLVKDSALHYLGFLDSVPEKIHLGTSRSALRINDDRVVQHFYSGITGTSEPDSTVDMEANKEKWDYGFPKIDYSLSNKNLSYYKSENNNEIRLFNLNALLADVIRDRKNYSEEEFRNILHKFRDCSILYKFSRYDLESFVCRSLLGFDEELEELLEEIENHTWDREFRRKFNSY